MIRPLVHKDHPVLRQVARPITADDPDVCALIERSLIDTVIDTIKNPKHGVVGLGLSAPQIGEPYRLIVVWGLGMRSVLVNPVIIQKSPHTTRYKEGCLSLPGVWVEIERSYSIELEYSYDYTDFVRGIRRRTRYSDLLARVMQHEMDHLDGKLITDYGDPLP